jgi:hypothetical protein
MLLASRPVGRPPQPSRRRLTSAIGLEQVVRRARARRLGPSARVPIARETILACEPDILLIAAALRSPRELPNAGVEAAWDLLTDGAGALYWEPGDLPAKLRRIEALLGLGVR